MNLFLPLNEFCLCEMSDENGPCDEQARWICHPQGYLQVKICLCDAHKDEVERQQREEVA